MSDFSIMLIVGKRLSDKLVGNNAKNLNNDPLSKLVGNNVNNAPSPSGKATDSDSVIPRFESLRGSKKTQIIGSFFTPYKSGHKPCGAVKTTNIKWSFLLLTKAVTKPCRAV